MGIYSALVLFFMSMVPVVELRGAIPYGFACELPLWETMLISILGNMAPTPFIVIFTRKIFAWLKTKKFLARFAEWCERRVLSKKDVLQKYELIGLAILVAIPLPGTGAWTGAMLAGLMNIRLKKALPAIFIGVVVAAAIVAGVSYGFLGAIDFLML